MIGIVICTFIVCVAVVICVLWWKYLDEQDDLSYPRFNEIKKRLDRVEKTINADQPYGGIFNEFGFDAKDNENGGSILGLFLLTIYLCVKVDAISA